MAGGYLQVTLSSKRIALLLAAVSPLEFLKMSHSHSSEVSQPSLGQFWQLLRGWTGGSSQDQQLTTAIFMSMCAHHLSVNVCLCLWYIHECTYVCG